MTLSETAHLDRVMVGRIELVLMIAMLFAFEWVLAQGRGQTRFEGVATHEPSSNDRAA